MTHRRTATVLMSLLLAATSAAPALAQSHTTAPVTSASGAAPVAGFTLPINATAAGQGTFSGLLRMTRFVADGNNLVAIGLLTGTLVDDIGRQSAIIKNVSIPVVIPPPTTTAAGAKTAAACDVLNLVLGPLDLNLLGLVVHLDRVVLDVTAVTGAGALLGNLLCAVTGLLDGAGALADLASILNQLIGLLGA